MGVDLKPMRRVVTGVDERGRSKVVWDGPAREGTPMGGGRSYYDLWIWNETPAPLGSEADAAGLGYDFPGPPAGGHLRIVKGLGSPVGYDRSKDPAAEPRHPSEPESAGRIWSRGGRGPYSSHMHKTQTIDYAVLMAGGRECELDDGTVRLNAGDFVLDIGAWHQWHTPPEGSAMAFDMIAADFPEGPAGLLKGNDEPIVATGKLDLPDGVKPTRRVVIGDVTDGKSALISDGHSPDIRTDPARPGFAMTRLWVIDRRLATLMRETLQLPDRLEPPKHGSVFRSMTIPPDEAWRGRAGAAEVAAWFSSMGSPGASAYAPKAAHPYMQKTRTLDFCLILEGEAVLVLDTEEVAVKAGDVVIVRGTNHAWSNRSANPAIISVASHDAA